MFRKLKLAAQAVCRKMEEAGVENEICYFVPILQKLLVVADPKERMLHVQQTLVPERSSNISVSLLAQGLDLLELDVKAAQQKLNIYIGTKEYLGSHEFYLVCNLLADMDELVCIVACDPQVLTKIATSTDFAVRAFYTEHKVALQDLFEKVKQYRGIVAVPAPVVTAIQKSGGSPLHSPDRLKPNSGSKGPSSPVKADSGSKGPSSPVKATSGGKGLSSPVKATSGAQEVLSPETSKVFNF